jgi:hypothetical protein
MFLNYERRKVIVPYIRHHLKVKHNQGHIEHFTQHDFVLSVRQNLPRANEVVGQQTRDGVHKYIQSKCVVVDNASWNDHRQVLNVDYQIEVVNFRATSHFKYECRQHCKFDEVDGVVGPHFLLTVE